MAALGFIRPKLYRVLVGRRIWGKMKTSFLIALLWAMVAVTVETLPAIGAVGSDTKTTRIILLAKPSSSASTLSISEVQSLRNFVRDSVSGDGLTCTTLTTPTMSKTDLKRSVLKAKNACAQAKKWFPLLATSASQGRTNVTKDFGKVKLAYQEIVEYSSPSPSATPTQQAPSGASEAQKDEWRYLIGTYKSKIVETQRLVSELEGRITLEQVKLDVANTYGDTIRKSIQESTIASLKSQYLSWLSDISFYESLISSYQSKIDGLVPAPIAKGPSQAEIDSWSRLIALYESSMYSYESKVSSLQVELKQHTYWRTIADKYKDAKNVAKQDSAISKLNEEIASLNLQINEAKSKIDELRRKISGN